MAEPFASADDVADRWRPLTPAEYDLATKLTEDASDMVRDRWSDVDDRIESGALNSASVARVVAYMVKDAMSVPQGTAALESFTQTAGPFNFGGKFANPNGRLFFTADAVRLFDGATSGARVGWLL